jgi:hypothetical protein
MCDIEMVNIFDFGPFPWRHRRRQIERHPKSFHITGGYPQSIIERDMLCEIGAQTRGLGFFRTPNQIDSATSTKHDSSSIFSPIITLGTD